MGMCIETNKTKVVRVQDWELISRYTRVTAHAYLASATPWHCIQSTSWTSCITASNNIFPSRSATSLPLERFPAPMALRRRWCTIRACSFMDLLSRN